MKSAICEPKQQSLQSLETLCDHHEMIPRAFEILEVNWETGAGDVYTWALQPLDGNEFVFKPGQFNMLFAHGQGEVPISISADAASGPLIHTTRAVGGVTTGMLNLKAGDVIGVRGPYGTSWPVDDVKGKDIIVLCGGMGLPPLRPVIYHILKNRQDYGKVSLLYGARSPLDIVYRAELEQWQQQKNIDVLLTVDRVEGQWQGNVGVVPQLLQQLDINAGDTRVMMCGPEVMMHFSQIALNKLGILDDQIYVSMERNMKCAIGHCGHCQWGPHFICKDGPVFRLDHIRDLFAIHEL